MSESFAAPTEAPVRRAGASDLRMIAQVEQWMTAIRELKREQQSESTFRVRLRPAVAATE